jgi:hypothetical protein
VHRLVGDDVELKVARQHPLLVAADVEFENRREELAGVNELVQFLEVDRYRLGLFAAAVDYAWNAAFATNGAGGPLACPAARHDRELLDRCHVTISLISRALPPGVSETARSRAYRDIGCAGQDPCDSSRNRSARHKLDRGRNDSRRETSPKSTKTGKQKANLLEISRSVVKTSSKTSANSVICEVASCKFPARRNRESIRPQQGIDSRQTGN